MQVIGEMSNKSAPHRKFVQTFVLAEQPNGYFVLNDIFRYINEEEDEEEELDAAQVQGNDTPQTSGQTGDSAVENQPEPEPEAEAKGLTSSDNPAERQHDAEQVDKRIEEKLLKKEHTKDEAAIDAPLANGIGASDDTHVASTEDASAATSGGQEEQESSTPEPAEQAIAVEASKAEDPKEPEPTPVASPPSAGPAETTAQPPPPPKAPTKPTWASLVASDRSKPAAPAPASSTSPASSQPRAAAPATQPQAQPQGQPQTAPGSEVNPAPASQNASSGWQTAGNEHAKRQTRPQSISGPGDKGNVLAYVKNVTEKVDGDVLKRALLEFGDIAYFDVSRPKVSLSIPPIIAVFARSTKSDPELCFRRIRQ